MTDPTLDLWRSWQQERSEAAFELRQARNDDLRAGLRVLPLEEAACRRAAAVRRSSSWKGRALPLDDNLIAAICLERGAPRLTRSGVDFERVEALHLA